MQRTHMHGARAAQTQLNIPPGTHRCQGGGHN